MKFLEYWFVYLQIGWYHVRYIPIHPFSWSPRLGSFRNSAGHTYLVVANYYDSSVKLNTESLVYQAPWSTVHQVPRDFHLWNVRCDIIWVQRSHVSDSGKLLQSEAQRFVQVGFQRRTEDERYNDQESYQLMHSSRHSLCEHKTITFANSSKKYSGFGILWETRSVE